MTFLKDLTNEYDTFTFDLTNTSEPLRTTLAWTDYPGTTAAGGGLVNDLDLHVDDPSLIRYYPTNANQRGGTQMGINDTGPEYVAYGTVIAAIRFIPSSYPVTVEKALFFIDSDGYPASFQARVYADDGGGGRPGTLLFGPQTFQATIPGWIAVDVGSITINSDGFYVAFQPTATRNPYYVTDSTSGGSDNYYWNGFTWQNWLYEDLVIRAVMAEPDDSTNYDRVNNLVGVDIDTPPSTGDYTAQVTGYNVSNGPQSYALLNSGAITFTGASSYRVFGAGDPPLETFGRTGVQMDFSTVPAGGGNVTITMNKAAPSPPPPLSMSFADLDWNISSAMSGFVTQLVFHYDEDDLPGGMTEAQIEGAHRWDTGTSEWVYVGGTVDTMANTVTVDNVDEFSNWAIGSAPVAVELAHFEAWPDGPAIHVEWETATEFDNLGFNLYRSDAAEGAYVQLNDDLIPSQAPGSPVGAIYAWRDEGVTSGATYYYRLEDVDVYGAVTLHGPLPATAGVLEYTIYLPLVIRHTIH